MNADWNSLKTIDDLLANIFKVHVQAKIEVSIFSN